MKSESLFEKLLKTPTIAQEISDDDRSATMRDESGAAQNEVCAAAVAAAEAIEVRADATPARIAGAWLAAGMDADYAATRLAKNCQSDEMIRAIVAANANPARAVLALANARTAHEAAQVASRLGLRGALENAAANHPDSLLALGLNRIIKMMPA